MKILTLLVLLPPCTVRHQFQHLALLVTDRSEGLVAYDDDSQSDSEITSPAHNVRIPQLILRGFWVFPSCSLLFVSVSARIKS
jgi:hypothetical protein